MCVPEAGFCVPVSQTSQHSLDEALLEEEVDFGGTVMVDVLIATAVPFILYSNYVDVKLWVYAAARCFL